MSLTKAKPRRKTRAVKLNAEPAQITLARRLDMIAGMELQHGHHHAAEFLARRAQAIREGAR